MKFFSAITTLAFLPAFILAFIPSIAQAEAINSSKKLTLSSLIVPANNINNHALGAPPLPSGPIYTFFGAVAGSVNEVLLYTATDNTCADATENPIVAEINTGTAFSYTTTPGTNYRITSGGINAFLKYPTSGTYFIGMTFIAEDLNCSAAHCSASYDTAGDGPHHLCLRAEYTGGELTLTAADNHNVNLTTPMQFLYFADSANNSIKKCSLNSDGNISVCTPALAGLPNPPSDIVFTTSGGNQYAYIPIPASGSVLKCGLSTAGDGNLGSCVGITGSWDAPSKISFLTAGDTNQYAYVGDNLDGALYSCSLNNDGTFNACADSVSSGVSGVSSLAAGVLGTGAHYIYTAAYADTNNANAVPSCPLNTNGSIGSCTTTHLGALTNPDGMAFETFDQRYLYILDNNGGVNPQILACVFDENNNFNGCTGYPPITGNLVGLTFGSVHDNEYVYLSDLNSSQSGGGGYNGGKIWFCPVSTDNGFIFTTSCTWTPRNKPDTTTSWSPTGNPAVEYMKAGNY